ncbi:hypothetical protein [Actinophytocola sp.]|uniref:hypothetical protein n=1 Tax=Actinophytocola sp. TaxID=1872138 RepID=UPI003899A111
MKVRYNPVVGVVMVVLGAVCLFLGLWLMALGEFNASVLVGALVTLLGILYLVRPYFWVSSSAVELRAVVGPVRRTFPFRTLEVDGSKLVAVNDGDRKKLPVTRWMAHSGDWAAAVERATRR